MLKVMVGLDLVLVNYRGDAAAIADMLGGQVQVYIGGLTGTIEHIRAGRLRAPAVTTAMRSPALPDVPRLGAFLPSFEAKGWLELGAPKETPTQNTDSTHPAVGAAPVDPHSP